MKNSLNIRTLSQYALLFILSSFLFTSCVPDDDIGPSFDPCLNVTCLNGGDVTSSCDCNCPAGYSGSNCQTYDPCYNTNCLNGGDCINGACNCPTGFYGDQCQFAQIPQAVRITRIDLLEWPEYQSDGSPWDSNSGRPDIYLIIDINESEVAVTGFYEQCSLNNEYPYSGSEMPILVGNTSDKVTVRVLDWDGPTLGAQYMTGLNFFPDNYQSTLPSTRIIYYDGNPVIKFRVHFDWVF